MKRFKVGDTVISEYDNLWFKKGDVLKIGHVFSCSFMNKGNRVSWVMCSDRICEGCDTNVEIDGFPHCSKGLIKYDRHKKLRRILG